MTRKVTNDRHVAEVVRRIYANAQEADWEHLTHREHTEQYARWLADPRVGGVLSAWMSPEEQRVWLKDGPMKEFARALAGEGPFATYLSAHPRSPAMVVSRVLGEDWRAIPNSNGVKPLRCEATDGKSKMLVFWGPSKDFKYLLWAALDAWESNSERSLRIAVFDTVSSPTSKHERTRLERIAGHCHVPLSFIRLDG